MRRIQGGYAAFLAAIALLSAGAASGDDPAPKPSPWRDQALLEKRLAEACDAVEHVCGAKFEKRPTVRISTRAEIAEVVGREVLPVFEKRGVEMTPTMKAVLKRLAEAFAEAMLGRYEVATNVVHVIAENGEEQAGISPEEARRVEDRLRIVLAHEATHALDFVRFDWEAKRGEVLADEDSTKAFASVSEGHAQWVAEQVAWTWGLTSDFERLAKSISEVPDLPDPRAKRLAVLLTDEATFAYVKGLAFLKALAKAGGKERIEEALRAPPDSTRWIVSPEDWLARGTAGARNEPDLKAAVRVFRHLVADPLWKVTERRLPESFLKALGEGVPEERRKDFLRGLLECRALVAQFPEEGRRVGVIAMRFREEADADSFVETSRAGEDAALRRLKEPGAPEGVEIVLTHGAGPNSGVVPGFVVKKTRRRNGEVHETLSQHFSVGRFAVLVAVDDTPEIDRKVMDAAIAPFPAFVHDADAYAALEKPDPVALVPRTLLLEVVALDRDARPVPRFHARVTVVRPGDDGVEVDVLGRAIPMPPGYHRREEKHADAVGGVAKVRVPKDRPTTVAIWAARSDDDEPLPLAPRADVESPAGASRVEVSLEAGVEITGKVVGPDDLPAPNVTVEALAGDEVPPWVWKDPDDGAVQGRGTSTADGSFRIVGLAPAPYVLRLVADGKVVSAEVAHATGGDMDVRVVRPGSTSVVITVVDYAGKPVEGSLVGAGKPSPFPGARGLDVSNVRAGGRTDRNGRASLEDLDPASEYSLVAGPPDDREDLGGTSVEAWRPAPAKLVLPRGWTLRGIVVDEQGQPVKCWIYRREEGGRRVGTPNEDDGTFRFPGLPLQPVEVQAVEDRGPGPREPGVEGEGEWVRATPEKPEVRLLLRTRPMLLVRVQGPDGKAVRAAEVETQFVDRSEVELVHDGIARFPLEPPPDSLRISRALGADGTPLAPVFIVPRTGERELSYRLEPGVEIAGSVVDEAGKPIADVRLEAFAGDEDPDLPYPERWDAEARSSDDGAFVLRGVTGVTWRIKVAGRPGGFALPAATLAKGGDQGVRIVLPRLPAIVVTVTDFDGKPVAAAKVVIKRSPPRSPWRAEPPKWLRAVTLDSGVARLSALDPDEEVALEVLPPVTRPDLALYEDPAIDVKDIRSARMARGYVVTGRILDDAGRPVQAGVWSRCQRGARFEGESTIVAPDGTFTVRGLPLGPVEFAAARLPVREDRAPTEDDWVEATPESPAIELRLAGAPRTLRFRVPGTKKGRFGVLVREQSRERGTMALRFGDDGVASVEGVRPGTFAIWVPPAEGDDMLAWKTGVVASRETVTLELTKGLPVLFRVALPENAKDTEVEVTGPLGLHVDAESLGDGRYRVRALPPGSWTVRVTTTAGRSSLSAEADASAGGPEVLLEPK